MKKITKLFSTLLLLCVSLAGNAETKVTLGTEYTSVADLNGKAFAIINKTAEKAICNKNAGNDYDLQYLSYADAFSAPGCKFKIEQVTDENDADANGKYLIRCVDKDGGNYSIGGWASPYFQSNKRDDSHCCFFFALALDGNQKRGLDANNTAVWDIQYDSTNKGFTLKNVGTGKYYNDPTKDATSDTPAYFTFCDVKVEEILAPGTETLIYSYDYSEKLEKVPGYWGQNPNGKDSIDVDGGAYVIVNNAQTEAIHDLQVFIANGFNTKEGYKYKIKITMKANGAGEANLATGPWSSTNMDKRFNFTATVDWTEYTIAYDNAEDKDESGAHILWQSGKFVGEVKIKKVEVYEITPETPPAPKYWYTIFTDDCSSATNFCKKYFKNYLAATSTDGAIVVKSLEPEKTYSEYYNFTGNMPDITDADAILANDHDTQFLITLPAVLPNGAKVRFSMRCKADKEASAGTQAHRAAPVPVGGVYPIEGKEDYRGTYINWQLMGDVTFPATWNTYYKEFPVTCDGMQAICFNLNKEKESINYFFDDIIVAVEMTEEDAAKIPGAKILSIPLSVTSAGYATFTPAMDVTLPESVKAYTATLSDSKTSVNLTAITEIPAGTPVIIEAAENDYSLEVLQSAAAVSNNDLLVSDGTITGDGTVYVLANDGSKVGFFKLESGVNLPAGKAYLKIAGGSSREFIAINNEATAIKSVETVKANGAVYNLAGQQVKNAQKGIYIVNGKKVIK